MRSRVRIAAFFTDIKLFRLRCVLQNRRMDQIVINDGVGRLKRFLGFKGQEFRIARACADERDKSAPRVIARRPEADVGVSR